MTIHILNSLTIRPYLTPIHGGVTILLVETDQGPILVDAGLGLSDHLRPTRMMRIYRWAYRASSGLGGTAFQLVQAFGYRPEQVGHILLTHLHLDHAGGLADFPQAKVHIFMTELAYIQSHPNWKYIPSHWAHRPDWVVHTPSGEKWLGLDAIRLDGLGLEMWMVPLPGHTPGHVGIALPDGDGWILYGGDALPYNARVDLVPAWLARHVIYHHAPRLRRFALAHPEVRLVAGHMSRGFYQNQLP